MINKSLKQRIYVYAQDNKFVQCVSPNFVNTRQLYKLPMPRTRDWFNITMRRFRERSTTTPVGNGHYTTVGRLVPITTVMMEVPGVKMVQL